MPFTFTLAYTNTNMKNESNNNNMIFPLIENSWKWMRRKICFSRKNAEKYSNTNFSRHIDILFCKWHIFKVANKIKRVQTVLCQTRNYIFSFTTLMPHKYYGSYKNLWKKVFFILMVIDKREKCIWHIYQ